MYQEEYPEIDFEHLGTIKYVGLEEIMSGGDLSLQDDIYAWDHLCSKALITPYNKNFPDLIYRTYKEIIMAEDCGYEPTIDRICEDIDELNMATIQAFYSSYDFNQDDIDMILGNYVQEFSCVLEDWVDKALKDLGLPHRDYSEFKNFQRKQDYAPQNILFYELL